MEKRLLFALTLLGHMMLVTCCPTVCRCDPSRKIVYCNEKHLTRIPFEIPLDTHSLLLQGNELTNDQNLENVLSKLTKLERLDMHKNKLTSFPKNLPPSLVYLSLHSNSIRYIGKNVLNGLSNLTELHLDFNKLTDLGVAPGVFSAASSLKELELSYNQLAKFPEGLPESLKSVRVTNNNITIVKSSSLLLLRKLMVLDLSYNRIAGSTINFAYMRNLLTLNLNNNRLQNVPLYLPRNLTELSLASNRIQYVFTHSGVLYGSFQGLTTLKKLNLSSNRLLTVENKAFDKLPTQVSIELQHNPWECDCNLIYLKKWLLVRSPILSIGKGGVTCSTPVKFKSVKLDAIDVEDLTCNNDYIKPEHVSAVDPSSVKVNYDVDRDGEPPFVTYSLMYGVMLCKDCSLHGDSSSSSHLAAHLWMQDYTIVPLETSNKIIVVHSLDSNTRYIICLVASHQHPDEVKIDQCLDVRTPVSTTTPLPSTPLVKLSLPWILVIILGGFVLLIGSAILIFKCYNEQNNRNRQTSRPQNGSYRPGRPVNATEEFIIKVSNPGNTSRQIESWHSDSRDESYATSHTDTTNSRTSAYGAGPREGHVYETPFAHRGPPDNYNRISFSNQ